MVEERASGDPTAVEPDDALPKGNVGKPRAGRQAPNRTEWEAWRRHNRAAIEASNRALDENGLWCEDHRVW